jgi:hypothetical protein
MREILPIAKPGNQLGNATVWISTGIPAFGKQLRGQVVLKILFQHLRPVKIHQRMAITPPQWEDTEPFMPKDLIQPPKFGCHLFPAAKRAIEHIPRFQAGHGRRTAAN